MVTNAEASKRDKFAQIPAPLIRYLKPGQLNVWAGLKLHDFNGDGLVWPGQTRLVEMTGLTDTSIRKLTKQMHAMGVITMSPKGNGFQYRLHEIPADWTPNTIGHAEESSGDRDPADPEESSGGPEETSGDTRRKFGSYPKKVRVYPEETSDEVDKRNTRREEDETEIDEQEVETAPRSATGGQSQAPKRSNQDGQEAEEVQSTCEQFRISNAEPLAADDFLAELDSLMKTSRLPDRLAAARDWTGSPEELKQRHHEDLARRLVKHR